MASSATIKIAGFFMIFPYTTIEFGDFPAKNDSDAGKVGKFSRRRDHQAGVGRSSVTPSETM